MCPAFRAPAISRDQAGKVLGHSHLHHRGSNLIVGRLDVSKIGFADGLADNGGGFGVVEIALSLQLLRLLAAEGQTHESVGGCRSDVAVAIMGSFRFGLTGPMHAEHTNGARLRQRVFHEIAGAQVEYVRTVDLVELLFEFVKADYGASSAGFVGSETAERNNILDSRISYCRRDRVADAVLKSAEVAAGIVGWNHDVGCICLVKALVRADASVASPMNISAPSAARGCK
jgi:hypothetical protein